MFDKNHHNIAQYTCIKKLHNPKQSQIVMLCVHFVCLKVQKCHFLPQPPTRKLFLVSNEKFGENRSFLLWCYGIDFAPIKSYCPFFHDCIQGGKYSPSVISLNFVLDVPFCLLVLLSFFLVYFSKS